MDGHRDEHYAKKGGRMGLTCHEIGFYASCEEIT